MNKSLSREIEKKAAEELETTFPLSSMHLTSSSAKSLKEMPALKVSSGLDYLDGGGFTLAALQVEQH